MFKQLGFEFGDAPVGEAGVGAGALKSVVQGSVFAGKVAHLLLEGGVLREEPAVGVVGEVSLVVAQAGQELTYLAALRDDLGVSGLDAFLGVQGSVFPGGLDLPSFVSNVVCAGLGGGLGRLCDQLAGLGILRSGRNSGSNPGPSMSAVRISRRSRRTWLLPSSPSTAN